MIEVETIEWVAALAQTEQRQEFATKLARRHAALALFAFVRDASGALQPLLGLPQPPIESASWQALLAQCARNGLHRARVDCPPAKALVPAVALAGSSVVLIFAGTELPDARFSSLCALLPLLAPALRAQHALA